MKEGKKIMFLRVVSNLIGVVAACTVFLISCSKDRVNPLDPANLKDADPFKLSVLLRPEGALLSWQEIKSAAVRGYNVYRGLYPGVSIVRIGTVNESTLQYLDPDSSIAVGEEYVYTVAAFGANGVESVRSPAVVMAIPPPYISLSADKIVFEQVQFGQLPQKRNIVITNTGGGTLNWHLSLTDTSWLNVYPLDGQTDSSMVFFEVKKSDLSTTTYSTTIEISSSGAVNSPKSIIVEYEIYNLFQPRIDVSATGYALMADDIDASQTIDLILAGDSGIIALYNEGNAQFHNVQISNIFGRSLDIEDMNNDGMKDIIIAGSRITILINKGNHQFDSTWSSQIHETYLSCCAGDIIGDDKLDVIAGFRDGISVFEGQGDSLKYVGDLSGDFTGSAIRCVSIDDLDGDGDNDISFVTGYALAVKENVGDIMDPYPPAFYQIDNCPIWMQSVDIDNDNDKDIAVAPECGNELTIFKNIGFADFAYDSSYYVGTEVYCVAAGDLYGDGDNDLISVCYFPISYPGSIAVLRNAGNGDFAAVKEYDIYKGGRRLVAADFNGDGQLDVAAGWGSSNIEGISILLNNIR